MHRHHNVFARCDGLFCGAWLGSSMTRDELITECKRRSEGGDDVQAVIGYLRTSGCSKIDLIAVLNATYGIGLAEAKKIVHFSR